MKEATQKFGSERGASIVEFAVSVGVLVFLIFGVLETGRLITQFAWVSQTLYEITLTGSENLSSVGVKRMGDKSSQFASQLNKDLSTFSLSAQYDSQTFTDSFGVLRPIELVSAQVNGDLIPFYRLFNYDIGLKYTAIHAATAQPLDASLQSFGLIDGQQYECDAITPCGPPAVPLGTCPSTPCCNIGLCP